MNRIEVQFAAYSEWRGLLWQSVTNLRTWLQGQDLQDAQIDHRLEQALGTLHDDKLHIAFVAEFSRGKSELINAIFFADFGQRVLPSSAGRTTMCPTELLYDPEAKPCLRLLPIETRASSTTIAELKGFPEEWTLIPLDVESPDSMAAALAQIAAVKPVPRATAQSFGLHVAESEGDNGMPLRPDGDVEVPKWRHALVNLPHPMLEQGLVILDTPGLNALGAEPELTLSMLPNAHAVLFILAADTGVTKSDIEIWQDHIQNGRGGAHKGRLVVLNKIDGLWDELRDAAEVEKEIERQIQETARHLQIDVRNIYPVSAQKALLGKIKGNPEIIQRSRIHELEDAMARDLIPEKQEIVASNVRNELGEIRQALDVTVEQRLRSVHEHMEEISSLNGKNMDVIEHMMEKVRIDKDHFEKSMQRFQATRSIFSQQTNILYSRLDLRMLDKTIAATKKNMEISLTTAGIKASMDSFFSVAQGVMDDVAKQAQDIKELMDGVYRKFQQEHGLIDIKPAGFSVMKYTREIKRVKSKHEQLMNGMSLVLTEQKAVVRKFFGSAVHKVRAVFAMANADADAWLKNIMSPMESQVREHQTQLRRRLESIKRIYKASSTLEDRLDELKHVETGMRDQERELARHFEEIMRVLETPAHTLASESVRRA
ncbi:MAG: dynamin family protein [Acidiferrobacteraceae bacterium]